MFSVPVSMLYTRQLGLLGTFSLCHAFLSPERLLALSPRIPPPQPGSLSSTWDILSKRGTHGTLPFTVSPLQPCRTLVGEEKAVRGHPDAGG